MKRYLGVLIMILSGLLLGGCILAEQADQSLPQGSYVVVREKVQESHQLIEGDLDGVPGGMMAPMQQADYDGSQGRLSSYATVNGSLKALYITERDHHVSLHEYTIIDARGVYATPFEADDQITLRDIGTDGTIYFSYLVDEYTLKPGESWTSPIADNWVETKDYDTNVTVYSENGTQTDFVEHIYYKLRLTTTITIENVGMFDKLTALQNESEYPDPQGRTRP